MITGHASLYQISPSTEHVKNNVVIPQSFRKQVP